MMIKGTALLARRTFIVQKFGEAAWNEFVAQNKPTYPFLNPPIIAASQIPAQGFLACQDALNRHFFHGDSQGYWTAGKESGKYVLGATGPYRAVLKERSAKGLADKIPFLWGLFYDVGEASLKIDGNQALFTVKRLPIKHPYFELVAAGFVQAALELVEGKTVPYKRLSESADGYVYSFGPVERIS